MLVKRSAVLKVIHDFFFEEIEKTPTMTDEYGEHYKVELVEPLLSMNKELTKRIKEIKEPRSAKSFRWVPVSERLPKKGKAYLVCIKPMFDSTFFIDVKYFAKNLYLVDKFDFPDKKKVPGFYDIDSEWGHYEVTGVIAWMDLPEPYKEPEQKEGGV